MIPSRGLSPEFMADLLAGNLLALRKRVLADQTLCLEIRRDAVSVYYRGGSLLRLDRAGDAYVTTFDPNYSPYHEGDGSFPTPPFSIRGTSDTYAWLAAFPALKQAIDLFLGRHGRTEREIQQLILRDNNFGPIARSSDYYFCDLEYDCRASASRFDLVGIHWPSTSSDRKAAGGRRLVLAEVKHGDSALAGECGLASHITDINEFLADTDRARALALEMAVVFNQKRALGLLDCGKDLDGFGNEKPILLLLLVNHDPQKTRLREVLESLPHSPNAEIRVATGSLLGYGLYDPAIVSLEEARARVSA